MSTTPRIKRGERNSPLNPFFSFFRRRALIRAVPDGHLRTRAFPRSAFFEPDGPSCKPRRFRQTRRSTARNNRWCPWFFLPNGFPPPRDHILLIFFFPYSPTSKPIVHFSPVMFGNRGGLTPGGIPIAPFVSVTLFIIINISDTHMRSI